MHGHEIVEVFPFTSDDDAREVVAFHNEISRERVHYHRDSTIAEYRAKNDEPSLDTRHFVARTGGGDIVGLLMVSVWVDGTNEHLVWVQMGVRADSRREGLGRTFLRKTVEIAKKAGRSVITGDTIDTVPDGRQFSEAVGAEIAIHEVRNTVLTASIDLSMLEEWSLTGPSRAPGYEVIVFDGPFPQEYHEDIARLFAMAEEDMPYEDLDLEPMTVTAQLVAERTEQLKDVVEWTTSVARHTESGQLVGFSGIIVMNGDTETLQTTLTVVDRDHRGFALGKWIKSTVILRALDKYPDALRIVTENAASNAPMLGINEAIGFKPEFQLVSYQTTVEKLAEYLNL